MKEVIKLLSLITMLFSGSCTLYFVFFSIQQKEIGLLFLPFTFGIIPFLISLYLYNYLGKKIKQEERNANKNTNTQDGEK